MINRLFIPGNKEQIKTICKNGFNSFILPVENLSIGFSCYFNFDEIEELSKTNDIYLMINKFLHCDEIESVINKLNDVNVKGLFIEDLGLITNLKDKNVILFQNHLNMSYEAINMWNSIGMNSIMLSNELTIEELEEIKNNTSIITYYNILGKPNMMYTRRNLLTNYYNNFNIDNTNKTRYIEESVSRHRMIVKEEDYGTAIINSITFSGYRHLRKLETLVDNFVYNFTLLTDEEVNVILTNIDNENLNDLIECEDYFLNNKIYYKVKDVA